jgi:hypothetical protein
MGRGSGELRAIFVLTMLFFTMLGDIVSSIKEAEELYNSSMRV